jgi:hypothetical protein
VSWVSLSQHAEGFYAQWNIQEAFDMYQKSLKILKDENIITKIPAIIPGALASLCQ